MTLDQMNELEAELKAITLALGVVKRHALGKSTRALKAQWLNACSHKIVIAYDALIKGNR